MNTFIILFSIVLLIVCITLCYSAYEYGTDKTGRFWAVMIFVSILAMSFGIERFVNKGEYQKEKLLNNPNILFLSDRIDYDMFRLLPKLKKHRIVIEDGDDIEYYEIIK